MIKSIKLKFGRSGESAPDEINITPVTIFVGPNNSGKSTVLNEIYRFCLQGESKPQNVILNNIDFCNYSPEKFDYLIGKIQIKDNTLTPGKIKVRERGTTGLEDIKEVKRILQNPNSDKTRFCSWFLYTKILFLNAKERFSLTEQQKGTDLSKPPKTSFQKLFSDEAKKSIVQRIIKDAFDKYFFIDPTDLGTLKIRLSEKKPKNNSTEKSLDVNAVEFFSKSNLINDTGDGVKAFIGIITEVIAGEPTILLIDDPEAFLHPSLAYKLGKEISISSSKTEKKIFFSTHSTHFVMGCIQSGVPITIIRLTYRSGAATARILLNEKILGLMRNPLLRSTGIIEGLFYDFVIVTEGDTDRAFYQEINERNLRFNSERGIPNCMFVNAQNKQTIGTIMKPLRELGIPVACIVDIDILKEGGQNWRNFLKSGFIPEPEINSLCQLRGDINKKFGESGKDMKKDGGIELLCKEYKEASSNLISRLNHYGLFIVEKGEVEDWLKYLGIKGRKSHWLMNIFERMGEDPDSEGYVKPSENDVWKFLGNIKDWFFNYDRKGIPD